MQLVLLSFAIVSLHRQADAVRGALVLKKSHQQSMDSDDNVEELEELEEEEGYKQSELDKASIYEQGETRDFLQFLRKIKYDHRQCPDDDNGVADKHSQKQDCWQCAKRRRGLAAYRFSSVSLSKRPAPGLPSLLLGHLEYLYKFPLPYWSRLGQRLHCGQQCPLRLRSDHGDRNTKKTHAQSVYLFEKDCTSQWHFH
ncbi:hypothetical protein Y032_0117g701 [Ancylostoma ceylanicum]|uniref:Uncharacterized protein n=1 Tax=Ancylostoma ceylanicum TaxID=53326 RepID=A0A016TC56_9BILA|nr:hypothetical protein Y032_0117g701 [Ancylostoma ceylanicum]